MKKDQKKKVATKTDRQSVRFDIVLVEKIKEKFGADTPQKYVNALEKIADQTLFPILGVPTNDSYMVKKAQKEEKNTQLPLGENDPEPDPADKDSHKAWRKRNFGF